MWCPSCIYFYDEVQQPTLPFPFRQAAEFLVEQLPRLTFTRGSGSAWPCTTTCRTTRAAARAPPAGGCWRRYPA